QAQTLEKLVTTLDRQQHQLVQTDARKLLKLRRRPLRALRCEALARAQHGGGVLARSKPEEQRVGLQPGALADRAGRVGAVLREQHADVHLVRLGLQPGEEATHAVPLLVFPAPFALEHPAALLLRELRPRGVERNPTLACVTDQIVLTLTIRLRLPRSNGALPEGLAHIRDDQPEIHAD